MDTEIKFRCINCERKLSLRSAVAGKKIHCPACQKKIQIPDQSTVFSTEQIASQAEPVEDSGLSFPCPNCNRKLSVKKHAAGKKIHCPACDARIQIPNTTSESAGFLNRMFRK